MNTKTILVLALALFIPAAAHAQNKEIVVQQPPPLPGKYAGGTPVSCQSTQVKEIVCASMIYY
jgi:hypothetical protein